MSHENSSQPDEIITPQVEDVELAHEMALASDGTRTHAAKLRRVAGKVLASYVEGSNPVGDIEKEHDGRANNKDFWSLKYEMDELDEKGEDMQLREDFDVDNQFMGSSKATRSPWGRDKVEKVVTTLHQKSVSSDEAAEIKEEDVSKDSREKFAEELKEKLKSK